MSSSVLIGKKERTGVRKAIGRNGLESDAGPDCGQSSFSARRVRSREMALLSASRA